MEKTESGYKCPSSGCYWETKYQYRNAKRDFKRHWDTFHIPPEEEPTEVILDFCAYCGVLLPEGVGLEDNLTCHNCSQPIDDRGDRCQGTFSGQDAEKMRQGAEGEGT